MCSTTKLARLQAEAVSPSRDKHRNVLLVLLLFITCLNLTELIYGAVVAGTLNFTYTPANTVAPSVQGGRTITNEHDYRTRMVFFCCTIPFVLSALSVYDLVRHRRLSSKWIVYCSVFSIVAMALQFGLEGSCFWTALLYGNHSATNPGSFCPLSFWGTGPEYIWGIDLNTVLALPWLCLPSLLLYLGYLVFGLVALRQDLRTQAWGAGEPASYRESLVHASRTSKAQTLSMYTMSSAPRPETLQPSEAGAKSPPSYRSNSMTSQEAIDCKEY